MAPNTEQIDPGFLCAIWSTLRKIMQRRAMVWTQHGGTPALRSVPLEASVRGQGTKFSTTTRYREPLTTSLLGQVLRADS